MGLTSKRHWARGDAAVAPAFHNLIDKLAPIIVAGPRPSVSEIIKSLSASNAAIIKHGQFHLGTPTNLLWLIWHKTRTTIKVGFRSFYNQAKSDAFITLKYYKKNL